MRNLKKILALVMALAMSLSLITIANAADFTDNDDISYEEAAEVMSAIGVIEGFEDGSFDPDGTLTREQAAKLVTYMLLGKNANNLGVERSTFKDVLVTRWSAPAIEYCVSLGIIDGAGDGNFYPAGQLTGAAFAKVLLTALGYSSEKEGMTGASWSVNVAALAMEVGLDDGIENLSWNAVLTREEAAQMALNAIKSPLVAYENDVTVMVGDTPVSFGSGDAYYITTTLAKEQRISDAQLSNTKEYTVEFGEKYFPNLRLIREADEFERPSHTWTYNGDEIGAYTDYDLQVASYTEAITGRDLYDLLGRTTIEDYSMAYYVDGVADTTIKASNMIRTNTRDYGTTDNGVLTQVFVDHANEEITITSVNTYLAKANADYNEKRGELSLTVYESNAKGTGKTVDVEDIDHITGYKEGDFMLVNMAPTGSNGKLEVVRVNDVESMTDCTVTRFSKGSSVTVDGEQYKYAAKAFYDDGVLNAYGQDSLTNYTYTFYMDQYGYVIGADIYEGEANYLFMTGYDRNASNLSITTATAAAIFLDGTMSEIKINVKDTQENIDDYNATAGNNDYDDLNSNGESEYNAWFTYTTVEKNGSTVYTLTPAEHWVNDTSRNGDKINSASVRVGTSSSNRAYGNDDSVYITVDTDVVDKDTRVGITETTGTYTGVQNVDLQVYANSENALNSDIGIFACYDDDNYIIGAIVVGEDANATKNYAYVLDSDAQSEWVEGDDYYWDFEAVVDGAIETLTIKSEYKNVITQIQNYIKANRGAMYRLTYDADGYVVEAERCVDKEYGDVNNDYVYGSVNHSGQYDYTDRDIDPDFDKIYSVNVNDQILNVKSRTLFIGNAMDYGLTVASDATFIVVQNEEDTDGKLHMTQEEYSTISQALDNVAVNSNGQFKGWVDAVLNDNGTAKYLVFNSDYTIGRETDDGSGNGTTGRLGYNYTISRTGQLILTLDYERPEYVPETASVTLNIEVYSDGAYVETLAPVTIPANQNRVTVRNAAAWYETDENISLKVIGESYSAVKVLYKDENGSNITSRLVSGYTETLATSGSNTVAFQVNTTSTGNGLKYAISGLTSNVSAKAFTTNDKTAQSEGSLSAKGNDYVVVTISGLNGMVNNYTVTGITSGTAVGSTGKTIEVTASRNTVPSGAQVTLTATLNSAIANSAKPIRVTLNNGSTFVFANDNSATTATANITVTSDVTLSISKVEELETPTVKSAEINDVDGDGAISLNDVITLHFSQKLSAAPAVTSNGAVVFDSGNLAGDGMSATYKITTAPTATTDSMKIAVGALEADGTDFVNTVAYEIVTSNAPGAADNGLTVK